MFVIKENEREYRFGDSGPKYLMRGPRSNFAVVKFNPGQDFPAHYDEPIVMVSTLAPFRETDKFETTNFHSKD